MDRQTKVLVSRRGRKQRGIYFPLRAFVIQDKHIMPTPPYTVVLCTQAYLRGEAIIIASSEPTLTPVHSGV